MQNTSANYAGSALQIIAFYFEYLTHDVHPSLSSKMALMPGATTFLLLNSGMKSMHPEAGLQRT
jgi:hypothetical protein